VPPAWIVEPIDVLEYCTFSLPADFPFLTPYQLGFQGFEESFDHEIVITITLAAHRDKKAMLL
jgi:hypothetical protein